MLACRYKNRRTHPPPGSPPSADFVAGAVSVLTGQAVPFTNLSTGGPFTANAWDFGDGDTSTLFEPTHAFTSPGTYTVRLTETNAAGPSAPRVRTNYITVTLDGSITTLAHDSYTAADGTLIDARPMDTGQTWIVVHDTPDFHGIHGGQAISAASSGPWIAVMDAGTPLAKAVQTFAPYGSGKAVEIVANFVDAGNYWAFGFYPAFGVWAIRERSGGGDHYWATAPGTWADGTAHDLGIETNFDAVNAYLDGALILSFVQAGRHNAGSSLFGYTSAVGSGCAFDEWHVYSLSGVPGPTLFTPYDEVPNAGFAPTKVGGTGNWSAAGTWTPPGVPMAGAVVRVEGSVVYDVASPNVLMGVCVYPGGTLTFSTTTDTKLVVCMLQVLPGGVLNIGTLASPIGSGHTCEIILRDDAATEEDGWEVGVVALGKLRVCGAPRTGGWVRLAAEPHAGDTTLHLATTPSGWAAGDVLLLPDSRQLMPFERASDSDPDPFPWHVERPVILSISGSVVTLTAPLAYNHPGGYYTHDGTLAILPCVANTTKNVLIRSHAPTGFRGYTYWTYTADVDVRNASLLSLGRTRLGNGVDDRYPVGLAHLCGPAAIPASGYQYVVKDCYVADEVVANDVLWPITIAESFYGLIQGNVIYNGFGAGIMQEQGQESYNVIDGNFIVDVNGQHHRADAGKGLESTGMWLSGPNNHVTNNVCAQIGNGKFNNAYGITHFFDVSRGLVTIPAYQGADPFRTSQASVVNMGTYALLEFAGNEVYGSTSGYQYWFVNCTETGARSTNVSTLSLTLWNFYDQAIFAYYGASMTFNPLRIWGHPANFAAGAIPDGFFANDYQQAAIRVENSDIQGTLNGFTPSTQTSGDPTTLVNTRFCNARDVWIQHLWISAGSSDGLAPRRVELHGCSFLGGTHVWMHLPDLTMLSGTATNLIQTNTCFVYDYQGTTGDNFQAYFPEQAPDVVVPQSELEGGVGPAHVLTGSPDSGRTNAQNWADHGIAIAGAVSPTSATRANITGFVRAF